MSKKCAKCEKTVYPTEEFRCLDKTWHKGCFKCWECGMTLGMKTYKGYDKKPYCSAHYPKLGFTAAADTPEMARLAQNTKLQSQVKYHEEFEKNIKGTKVSVVDEPELERLKKNQSLTSQIEYTGVRSKHAEMEQRREQGQGDTRYQPPPSQQKQQQQQQPARTTKATAAADSPMSAKNQGHSTAYSTQGKVEQAPTRGKVGSIADYDPMSENWGSLGGGYMPVSGTSGRQEWEETYPAAQQQQQQPASPGARSPKGPPTGGVPLVPINQPLNLRVHQPQSYGGAPSPQQPEPAAAQPQYYPPPQQPQPPPPQQQQQQAPPQPPPPRGPVYKAMYDYEAQDDDEVGFQDGDVIIDIEVIDEGWMFGTVQRSGKRGMLPANYVEKV